MRGVTSLKLNEFDKFDFWGIGRIAVYPNDLLISNVPLQQRPAQLCGQEVSVGPGVGDGLPQLDDALLQLERRELKVEDPRMLGFDDGR
jgi:hypothetical protein